MAESYNLPVSRILMEILGTGHFYKTKFLRHSEEGGGIMSQQGQHFLQGQGGGVPLTSTKSSGADASGNESTDSTSDNEKCLHHNQPSISSLKTTSTKADTHSLLPKEDTLPRCQAPAETPDCQSSQTVKPNSHDTCHHRGDLHKVPHRKSTPTSHFHFPIKREQYPSKRGNYFSAFYYYSAKVTLLS
ncbi:unnamed protein product [Prunus armeniaca]